MIESSDGVTWTVMNPPPDPDHPGESVDTLGGTNALFHSGTFFVSSQGNYDVFVSSAPGQCSLVRAPLPYNTLNGLSPGPAGVVCASRMHSVLLHFTGSSWTPVDMAAGSPRVLRLAWTGGRYVAIVTDLWESDGRILTSPDGVTWTPRTTGVTTPLNQILWTGNQAIAVGDGGVILTSPDGATWTKRESGTTRKLRDVAWSGTAFAAVGEAGVILTSPDGAVWTKRNEPEVPVNAGGLTWLSTGGYAVAQQSTPAGTLRSADGLAWTRTAAPDGPAGAILGAATNGTRTVITTGEALWHGPADGSSWTSLNSTATSVLWDGEKFFVLYIDEDLFDNLCYDYNLGGGTSTDGLNWNLEPSLCPARNDYGNSRIPCVWTGQFFVRKGRAWHGSDYRSITGNQGKCDYLVWTGSQVLSIGADGQVCSSPTGEHWTEIIPAQTQDRFITAAPVWAGTQLVAGAFGDIRTWTAAGGWKTVSGPPVASLAWTGSRVIATSSGGIYTLENLPEVPLTWASWKAQHFPDTEDPAIVGPEADPDGDGWRNLIEYASCTQPASHASQPSARIVTGSGNPVFEWSTETAHAGVTLKVQVSDNLTAWDDIGSTVVQTQGTVVTRRASVPAPGRYFFRLAATLQN